jgi:transposase
VFTCYVELAVAQADLSSVTTLAIDETSRARGHDDITLAADAQARRVVFVTEGRDAGTIEQLAEHLQTHGGAPEAIESVSIDMSAAFIKGVREHLPAASITFDKFHVIAHASAAVDRTRRLERRADPALKGLRWTLLKDRADLSAAAAADLDALIGRHTMSRTARAWIYNARRQLS